MFYIPFGYYYAVRLGTVPKLLSWMLIYIMPTAFYSWLTYEGAWLPFIANYLLVLLAVFSLYELGYIFNDTVAIRHEQQPAIRLYKYNFAHFDRYRWWISAVRIAYAVLALRCLAFNCSPRSWSFWLVCVAVTAILPVFTLYNRWRSKDNVWLYPVLVFSRYLPFMLLYRIDGWAILLLWLSFPLVNWLERFSMPVYRFPFMQRLIPNEKSKTIFRVAYYVVLFIPSVLFCPPQISRLYFLPIDILCCYRLIIYFYTLHHSPKNYLNG